MQEERSRASQSGATKPLSVMDVVELSEREGDAGGGRRPRAMVLKTQGVPGLNKISVRYAFQPFLASFSCWDVGAGGTADGLLVGSWVDGRAALVVELCV